MKMDHRLRNATNPGFVNAKMILTLETSVMLGWGRGQMSLMTLAKLSTGKAVGLD